jgi:hypothetical protein
VDVDVVVVVDVDFDGDGDVEVDATVDAVVPQSTYPDQVHVAVAVKVHDHEDDYDHVNVNVSGRQPLADVAAARCGGRRNRRLRLARRRRITERDRERIVDLRHEPEVELVADLLRQLERVLAVALGQEHDLDAGAVSGQHLLLDAADR